MKHPADDFGPRLRKLRRARGYSQPQLATCIQMSEEQVSEWENDRARPKFEALVALGEVLDVNLHFLIRGEGQP